MEHKTVGQVEIKNSDRGEFSAIIATFDRLDADRDVVRPGAFTEGADCVLSAYGHQSWMGALPVGRAKIRTTPTEAIADGKFILTSTGGRDTFEVVKSLAEAGLGEWSWGFDIEDEENGTFDGQKARFLHKVTVYEVSPVLKAASVGTRTLAVKSVGVDSAQDQAAAEYARFVKWQLDQVVAEELADIRERLEFGVMADRLRWEGLL
jgi:hypothetical protein